MATYIYQCLQCKRSKAIEVQHGMDFVGKEKGLPQDILTKITCKIHGLKSRVPQLPQFAGASGGQFKSEKTLLSEKQQQRKLRSRTQFKNEVLPTLKGGEKRHFEKKLKNIKSQDHEKM
jgi:hypothetical protein